MKLVKLDFDDVCHFKLDYTNEEMEAILNETYFKLESVAVDQSPFNVWKNVYEHYDSALAKVSWIGTPWQHSRPIECSPAGENEYINKLAYRVLLRMTKSKMKRQYPLRYWFHWLLGTFR